MASSSSASDSQWKYDVFLSFRGADTRKTFTGHLYVGLKNRGIFTFQDDKRLEDDDFISEELLKAIEESQIALIIFSKNYATSSWCLDELVKIMECKEKNGKLVIPIFYDVEPSHVRKQTESFAEAFPQHKSRYENDVEGMQKVEAWRTALTAAANLKGHDIRDGNESDCIQQIVDQVSSKLCKASVSNLRNVVGINTHLEKVNSLLEMEVNDVRIVGIWGMGGVGKTTIARAIFDTLSPQFDGACFLADIKENKGGMHSLQNTLLSEVLRKKDDYVNNKEDGKHMIARRLRFKKVLVVLDDIDHNDHLDYLAEYLDWFGKGSRIIATTRDKHLIGKNDVIYKVTPLLDHDAIKLFHQYAFKGEVPGECFEKLSLEIVSHAKGLPLALKVWGSFLHKRDITEWRSALEQMKTSSKSEIVQKLKISYDGLEIIEKDIFLDIACFFRGRNKDYIMPILESCYSGADIGLSVLIDKSLVFISKSKYGEHYVIQMHDLIEDMGKYIVNEQKNPGERSRLWDVEDIEEAMVNNTGTMAVEEIWVPFGQNLPWKEYAKAMKNMQKLRMLCIGTYTMLNTQLKEYAGSVEYLPNNLRLFIWKYYPWQLLPQNFNPTNLVHLELQHSSLHHLWDETKHLPSLRRLDLSGSRYLKRTPDFTGMPNLEYLDLSICESLEEVHHSLKLPYLRRLDLSGLEHLKRTPDFTGMPNLEYLNLSECESLEEVHYSLGCSRKLVELDLCGCEKLKRFPCVNMESLNSLHLSDCSSLQKLPEFRTELNLEIEIMKLNLEIEMGYRPNIHLQPHLKELDLSGIDILVALPSFICKLKCLVKLYVSWCSKLECLPEEIADLENLEVLDARDTIISRPPSSIIRLNKLKVLTFAKEESEDGAHSEESKDGEHFVFPEVNEGLLSLEQLHLSCCNLIDGGLPEDIGSLFSLKKLNLSGNNFEHLPRSIAQLGALQSLDLSWCGKLKEFPDFTGMTNLEYLDLNQCWSLEEVHHSLGCSRKLVELNLFGCKSLKRFPYVNVESLKSLNLKGCSSLQKLPEFRTELNLEIEIMKLNLEIEIGYHKIHLQPHLKELDLSGIDILVALPSFICKLKCLVKLDVSGCSKLECLPKEIADLENLEVLDTSDTLISRPPSSIIRLNKLKVLTFAKEESEDGEHFVFPEVNEGLLSLEQLDLSCCNLTDGGLPEDIGSLSSLKELDLSCCNLTDGGLPEDIGCLSSLKVLNLCGNNFEHLPRSIAQLGALQSLDLRSCNRLKELPCFMGMTSLRTLDVSYCNLIDGGLPEDIGCLSSLKVLNLSGNNFEYLPQSIAQLGALWTLDLSHCIKLKEFPCFTGMTNLDTLNLSCCVSIDGGLPEDIGCLSSLKVLNLRGNNFEYLPQSIAQLGALRSLDLSYCKRLRQLPEFPRELDSINAEWRNDSICNSLFRNISSLQHAISASDSLSLRMFNSQVWDIPSWFHHQGMGRINLPENWYVSDNFLGFAICYFGKLMDDITVDLIPLCNDGTSWMTQNFSLSKHNSAYCVHFLLVPLAGLWDESKANGKTQNDYGSFRLFSTRNHEEFGVRLLYKDEPKLQIGMKRSRDEEGSCSSSEE